MDTRTDTTTHRPLNIVTLLGRLEKSGMKRETAEIFVETVVEVQEHNVATKLDLKETEARLQIKIAESKADLIKWMIGALIAQAGLIIGIIGFLTKNPN